MSLLSAVCLTHSSHELCGFCITPWILETHKCIIAEPNAWFCFCIKYTSSLIEFFTFQLFSEKTWKAFTVYYLHFQEMQNLAENTLMGIGGFTANWTNLTFFFRFPSNEINRMWQRTLKSRCPSLQSCSYVQSHSLFSQEINTMNGVTFQFMFLIFYYL